MPDLPLPSRIATRLALATPFAVLGIRTAGERLTGIEYLPQGAATLAPVNRFAERVCRQIERYLDDPGFRFDLPFDYRGTEFQCRVWRAIHAIPSGRTLTYVDIARRLRTAPRPVGGACGANRIPLVIPCHRVLGERRHRRLHARARRLPARDQALAASARRCRRGNG